MTTATQVEILDIRHFNARQLRPLLEQEAILWRDQLRWDYRSSTELLLQYLDAKVLPGYVALDHGHICGYTFCVYEGVKAIVGDAFALPTPTDSALQITRTLLRHLLEVLVHTPTITRIESQLLLYNNGEAAAPFLDAGFTLYPRLFMECDLTPGAAGAIALDRTLDRLRAQRPAPPLPPGLSLRRWSGTYYEAAAGLIHQSYAGHLDALINDQYRSVHGSIRFLHNIVRFPGCGVFEPDASWVVLDQPENRLAGMLLCSIVSDKVAHITQLCVGPDYRGIGLGRTLLRHCIQNLFQMGYESISLTVTQENHRAVALYQHFGFDIRHRFDALVYERTHPFDFNA